MARAALLRLLAARHVAARAGRGACAATATAVGVERASLAAVATPTPTATALPLLGLLSTHHRSPSRLFASLSTAPSAASAAAAAPARAEEAPSASDPGTNGVVVSFPLAQTGEGISECELVRWHVSPGDSVEEFQPLCEVQSDKASIEITSRYAGSISALHHAEGAIVKVGAPLVDIRLPPGVPAPPGAVVVNGGDAGGGETVGLEAGKQEVGGAGASAAAATGAAGAEVLAPPAVRRLARELGVDLAALAPGSGVGGRVTKEDVQAAYDSAKAPPAVAAPTAPAAAPPVPPPIATAPTPTATTPTPQAPPAFERIPIRGYARTMLRTSTEALSVPMFYYFDEVRVDALARLRAELAKGKGGAGAGATRLTFLPFVVKALSVALAQHPAANASLELNGSSSSSSDSSQQQPSILRYKEHNVGVAMATPGGLVVPVVKNVERKTVAEVAAELSALQKGAAEGRLPPEALSGGTITVSNIGALGGTHATPLVHPPQAAIVALGRARALPRFAAVDGDGASASSPPRVESHLLMDVSWGADHRVVDGAEVARLSNTWRALLEEPSRLLLHLR